MVEYNAAGAAGEAPARPDRVKIISEIYRIVHKAVNNGGFPEVAMLTALTRRPDDFDTAVAALPADKVMRVVDFSPRQRTYAVVKDFEAEATAAFAAGGLRVMKLALDRPFNTPLCKSLVPVIHKFVAGWMKYRPTCDVYSCATADRLPTHIRAARDDVAGRWAKPVRFEETVRRMHADGYRVFLEVGPRGLMTAAIADTLAGTDHAAIALDSIHRRSVLQLQHALGQLAALGARPDLSRSFERRRARRLDFDSAISLEVRRNVEMRLSRSFPRLTLLSGEAVLQGASALVAPKGRGARAVARAAAIAQRARRQRQFDFGAMNPLVSDADTLSSSPGVSVEIAKTFRLSDLPFIGDCALGTSQMSYSDPNLKTARSSASTTSAAAVASRSRRGSCGSSCAPSASPPETSVNRPSGSVFATTRPTAPTQALSWKRRLCWRTRCPRRGQSPSRPFRSRGASTGRVATSIPPVSAADDVCGASDSSRPGASRA